MKRPCILAAILALGGCAATTADFSEQETALAARVRAIPASAVPPLHTAIGEVRSSSCDSQSMVRYPGATYGESLWLLKLETVRLGGDVVVDVSCRTRTLDPTTPCWESRRCLGKAAKLD